MSWGDIFFGFRGRINRKVYWAGSVAVGVAGFLFAALLAYLATGNPLAPEVWERPADKSALWGPVWLAYFGFLVWPSTALAVKRLHDRGRPAWIWYVYYCSGACRVAHAHQGIARRRTGRLIQHSWHSARNLFDVDLVSRDRAGVFRRIYLLRAWGASAEPAGLTRKGNIRCPLTTPGGDYNFWSWMLALEGRISRSKWWLGMFVLVSILIVLSFVTGLILNGFMSAHPELQDHINNPEWFNTKEAEPIISSLGLWMIVPVLVIGLVMWSLLALGVKRLHDRGLSSWLILVVVLPFLGALAAPSLVAEFDLRENVVRFALLLLMASIIWSVLQFGILKGETGPNEHGPDPLAG